MCRILLIGIALLLTTEVNAQNWSRPWTYHHASTAVEGYLSGKARLSEANGIALKFYGDYLVNNEKANSLRIQNNADRIRNYWSIKDEYKERNRRPTYLERKAKSLDMAEQRHMLKLREEELRKKGIIPPKKESYFAYKGVKFKNYEEFKKSDLYWDMIAERDERIAKREAEERARKARLAESNDFLRMWHGMSYLERERYSRLSPERKSRYIQEWKNPDLLRQRLEDDRNRKFYESYPYLIPNAGKNGYPPYPGK